MASRTRLPIAALCLIFALSGAAALVFEALLFRQAGLTFGNSIWAVSLVLASFMGGLALGNGLVAAWGRRIRRPLATYAVLEVGIGIVGLGLVCSLPSMTTLLAPLFRQVLDQVWLLNLLRLGIGLAVMLLPAVAMGMTLPILVGALSAGDPNFGRVLGRLYGWNTLGAVAGVLIAERVLVAGLGVTGAAAVAMAMNLLAATGAFALQRRLGAVSVAAPSSTAPSTDRRAPRLRILGAAFLCGATLLCLEVLWFRFFLLFTMPLGWNLAVMLAVVLAGIGLGGLAASLWFRWRPGAQSHVGLVALATGAMVSLLYFALPWWMQRGADRPLEPVYVWLMFPVAFGSGLLFPLLGRALHACGVPEVRAAGQITLANTVGSAIGSLLGGFVCLPVLGLDRSFFLMALVYGAVALLVSGVHPRAVATPGRRVTLIRLAPALVYLLAVAVFPFGAMARCLVSSPRSVYAALRPHGMELAGVREGPLETIQLFRKDIGEAPWVHQLATNGYSMSSTGLKARRYMKLYAYWPAAVHPDLEDALLISYGVGSTARALTDLRNLESIDVVDISEDILEVSRIIEPDPEVHPLNDPRVEVFLEDGRFFLEMTERRYDLITSEPPPPRNAGIVNLYSREYFELIRDRLRDGGIVTYWLPIYQLRMDEAKAIVQAFTMAFPNASLWSGAGLEWMMVGIRNPGGPVAEDDFARPWRDPEVGPALRRLGFLAPEQLGALFIADGPRLAEWLGETPPLDDDHPLRLAAHDVVIPPSDVAGYVRMMNSPEASANFAASAEIGRLFPAGVRERTQEWFEPQRTINRVLLYGAVRHRELHEMLEEPRIRELAPWVLDSDGLALELVRRIPPEQIVTGTVDADVYRHLAAGALGEGSLREAATLLERAEQRLALEGKAASERDYYFRIYLLLRAGETRPATELLTRLVSAVRGWPSQLERVREFWAWATATFELSHDWPAILAAAGTTSGPPQTAGIGASLLPTTPGGTP